MSGADGLRPRPGPAPKLIEGPKTGNRSLYQQHVLDEDTYTGALSHIIQRDFFPTLPHLHATNDYLSALANNDPELLSSSIRRLAKIAADKEDKGKGKGRARGQLPEPESAREHIQERQHQNRAAFNAENTPYMSVGARGWDVDTPRTDRRPAEAEDIDPPAAKRCRAAASGPQIRDDLSLDAFQRNYTSEDNASFAQIVDEENVRRREEKAWAWEAERVAEGKRIMGEEKRKLILDAATSGGWKVDANGRRLIGGLAEGARGDDKPWEARRLIMAGAAEAGQDSGSTALITAPPSSSSSSATTSQALIKASTSTSPSSASASVASASLPPPELTEAPLPEDHPLSRALATAGLPTTALVSRADGGIVPQREIVSGTGDGRGRGASERASRAAAAEAVMGHEEREEQGTQQWKYKAMNGLMFPPDANENAYPKPKPPSSTDNRGGKALGKMPGIAYRNTRLAEEDDDEQTASRAGSTRRGSSPARSWIDAGIKGTEYIPRNERNAEKYDLLPEDADPDPEDLPPLMTWGTLLATPRRLDGSTASDDLDLDGPTFRLPETKKRDELGRKLGSKASKSIAARAKSYAPAATASTPRLSDALRQAAGRTSRADRSGSGRGAMLPPTTSTPRREGMTPAARSLLDRSLGRTPQRGGGLGLGLGLGSSGGARGAAMEKGAGWGKGGVGGKSWTPSPAPRR